MGADDAATVVRSFVDAFDRHDVDAFAATLHPDVVIHAARGPRHGIAAARTWATRSPSGHLWQRVACDGVEVAPGGHHAIARVRRQWWWREPRELASEEGLDWLFELRDGLIASWRPAADSGQAGAWLHA